MSGPPRVGIDSRGRLVAVEVFPYREAIKDLPGARFLKRTAQHPPGWSLPATAGSAAALLTILADSGAQVSPRVLGLAQEGATREVRRAAAADESAPLPELPWHEWLTTEPWPHQIRALPLLMGSSAVAIGAGMGPQPVDTPILTPKGWRVLGDLAPGDEVFGCDGQPTAVMATKHFGVRPVYRVVLTDMTSTVCAGEHLWTVIGRQGVCTRSLRQLVDAGLRWSSGRRVKWYLPPQPELRGDRDSVLPVPPYLLGAMLANGCLNNVPELSTDVRDGDVRERSVGDARELGILAPQEVGRGNGFARGQGRVSNVRTRFTRRSGHGGNRNPVSEAFRELGLWRVTSRDKFVPEQYLLASADARHAVLQGLLDCDGTPQGTGCLFWTMSTRLAGQVAFLARSLGMRARYFWVPGKRSHAVYISTRTDRPLFYSKRKAKLVSVPSRSGYRGISEVTPIGEVEVCCITVAASNGLYLTDSALIPTHNCGKTLMTIGAMNALDLQRVLLVAPVATFGVYPRELRLHSAREWHTENGQRRTRKGAIRKLSLLDRWRAVQELYACDCGRPHLAIVGYEALVREPMASADLGALGVELVVYDEVHRLKAAGGGASWTAKSWVDQVPRRWGLSGTLLPQGPWDVYGTYRALDPAVFGTSKTRFDAKYIVMGQTKDGRAFPKDVFAGKREEFSRRFHSIAYVPQVDLRLPPVTHKIESFELEPSARALYDGIRDNGIAEITAAVIAAGGDPAGGERTVTPANAGVELLRFAQVTGGSVADDEGNTAVVSTAKADALAGVLERVGCRKGGVDGRSRPDPVVVFCRFRSDLVAVAGVCAKAGLRYREVSGSRKDGLDDEAKMHPECDVLGAQIASGGIGVDLTRARVNAWYSVGYELWLFQQAQKRSHRPGQTRQVLNVYLIANNTVDGDIYTALARREDVVESCMWAYLWGEAERDSLELPEMEVGEGEVAGEPMALPVWMIEPVPRPVPDREREAQAAALEAMGMGDF